MKVLICRLALALPLLCIASTLHAATYHDEYPINARLWLHEDGVATDTDSLLKALTEDARPVVRILAAGLLTSQEEPRCIPVLRSAIESEPDEGARAHFGEDLLKLQGESAHALVRRIFAEIKDLDHRLVLAGPLAELGDFTGYPDVLAGLEAPKQATQMFAAYAMGSFLAKCRGCTLAPAPVDEALRLLQRPALRPHLLYAISRRLDDQRVREALAALAKTDQDPFVRDTAKVFLDQAARESKNPPRRRP